MPWQNILMYRRQTEGGIAAVPSPTVSAAHERPIAVFPYPISFFNGTLRVRQMQIAAAYICVLATVACVAAIIDHPGVTAFSLGLMMPGGGFLLWAHPANALQMVALGLFGMSVLSFLFALVIWFATGNAILPFLLWFAAAVGSAWFPAGGEDAAVWQTAVPIVPIGLLIGLVIAGAWSWWAWRRGVRHRTNLNLHLGRIRVTQETLPTPATKAAELGSDDLKLLRLLLDRALQPVETFHGFEWIDQFQTAAVRYQVNFISYALTMAQSVHLPAFAGYLDLAQHRLAAKQQDFRLWRYWRLENLWGNLKADPDPIPRDNIMLSGFLAGQFAFHRNTSPVQHLESPQVLEFRHPSGEVFVYSEQDLIDVLCKSFGTAKHGLLACEPNWIYPLCNLITGAAIRASDGAAGTQRWAAIEPGFLHNLETQFIGSDGCLAPFRSTYTGITGARVGGAVMQAFPCFFLNAVFPDIARRQWEALKYNLGDKDWKDALWPVDVGNYGFSRASSYAATAAAAKELGDLETVDALLSQLDEECPSSETGGVAHRSKASLWAHAVELMARCATPDAFRSLVHHPQRRSSNRPYIKNAPYPDVLVAAAHADDTSLQAVLHSGGGGAFKTITIAGLVPDKPYVARIGENIPFSANCAGTARLCLPLSGRADLSVVPAG